MDRAKHTHRVALLAPSPAPSASAPAPSASAPAPPSSAAWLLLLLLEYTTAVRAGTKKDAPRQSACLRLPSHAKPPPAMTMASAATGAGGAAYSRPWGTWREGEGEREKGKRVDGKKTDEKTDSREAGGGIDRWANKLKQKLAACES